MKSASFFLIVGIAISSPLGAWSTAIAQRAGNDSIVACQRAVQYVRAYDRVAIKAGVRAAQGNDKHELRQLAVARLQRCGALGGITAASTIVAARTLTDTSALGELVGPYRIFRDTAVVRAVMSVAADSSASVPARMAALMAMWGIKTGKFWIGYDRLLPTGEWAGPIPLAACESGLMVTDAKPYWIIGVEPPPGFANALVALAQRLEMDVSQPLAVRAAATCVSHP